MKDPLVCAVMLTKDRVAMAARAIISFRRQTYEPKVMLIANGGPGPIYDVEPENIIEPCLIGLDALSIGEKRNMACGWVADRVIQRPDIFVHWDDDDWSHPNRIAEQVALLQQSGKDAVGYNDALFYIEGNRPPNGKDFYVGGVSAQQAWLYQNHTPRYALGTSLCYWRRTWERVKFPDKMRGEDKDWVASVNCLGVSSMVHAGAEYDVLNSEIPEPRMIASIHAGNGVRIDERAKHHWTRVAEWDTYCAERMKL